MLARVLPGESSTAKMSELDTDDELPIKRKKASQPDGLSIKYYH